MLHAGAIYRRIVLTVPARLLQAFYQQSQVALSPFLRCHAQYLGDGLVVVKPSAPASGVTMRAYTNPNTARDLAASVYVTSLVLLALRSGQLAFAWQ
jgi:hypothetical protein